MSLFQYYMANIIIISVFIFFILYINKTICSIRNTYLEFSKKSYNYLDTQKFIEHKHNSKKFIQQLIDEERNRKGIELQKTFYKKYKSIKVENVSAKKYIGGSSVEQQNIPPLTTPNPRTIIKTTVHGKYEKKIFDLKTLFLSEDPYNYKPNEAKYILKFLFTKPKFFINKEELKKFDKYLRGDLFKTLDTQEKINFNGEFWNNFVDYDFEEFKNILVSLVKKYNEIHNITFVQPKSITITDPYLSKMENNTCFVISLLYLIKTNSQLQTLIEVYCNDENYKQCLFKVLNKKDNEVLTEEEFNVLTNTSATIDRKFKFKEQNDSVYLLECILFDKCDLQYNQFHFLGELIVSSLRTIYYEDATHNIPRFQPSIFGSMMPILELHISDTNFQYDIQDILWGQKIYPQWYYMPIFLKSPVFLGIKINIGGYDTTERINCTKPTGVKDDKGKDIMINEEKKIYNFLPYGDLIFQEEIFIRSLSDGETKYELTGFLLYELNRTPGIRSGHYIPYYKLNGKWTCTYLEDRKSGLDVLPEFPLVFKFNKSYIVTMLFYEKVKGI